MILPKFKRTLQCFDYCFLSTPFGKLNEGLSAIKRDNNYCSCNACQITKSKVRESHYSTRNYWASEQRGLSTYTERLFKKA